MHICIHVYMYIFVFSDEGVLKITCIPWGAATCLWKRTTFLSNGRRANTKSSKHVQYLYRIYNTMHYYAVYLTGLSHCFGKAPGFSACPSSSRLMAEDCHMCLLTFSVQDFCFLGQNLTLKFGWIENWRFQSWPSSIQWGFKHVCFKLLFAWISRLLVTTSHPQRPARKPAAIAKQSN